MKHVVVIAFALVWSLPVCAQQRLAGKVVDASTGQAVPYASIGVLGTTRGTTSNAEGEFELREVALPGRLVVSELGHRHDTVAVSTALASHPLYLRLQPASVMLPEVRVGSYLGDLIASAYRQLRNTSSRKTYGQAFYRQLTEINSEAVEVQEMVWDAQSSNAGLDGSALAQGRFAQKNALFHFNNFSLCTKNARFNTKHDSTELKSIISLNAARFYHLTLIGVTQNATQQLVEIGFSSKPGLTPTLDKGRLVIDAHTLQILHFRLETPALFLLRIPNPLLKSKEQASVLEMDFLPTAQGAVLNYIKIDFKGLLSHVMRRNVAVHTASFTYFYAGRATPVAGVAYAPAKGGETDLTAIKQTTYDPAFWQNNPVVKRTPLEEEVMKSFEQKGAFGTMLTP